MMKDEGNRKCNAASGRAGLRVSAGGFARASEKRCDSDGTRTRGSLRDRQAL